MGFHIYRLTVIVHGTYYFLTGLWPVLHIESFMAVTGPKDDIWLVKTVGVLVMAIAIGVFSALGEKNRAIIVLGAACCIGFTLIDVYYVMNDTIRWVYLLDAAAEVMLLTGWLLSAFAKKEKTGQPVTTGHSGPETSPPR